MNAGGGDVRRVTDHEGHDYDPAWSPDGTEIAFWRAEPGFLGVGGNGEIHVVRADGSAPRQLTATGVADGFPAWSADGATWPS